MMRIFFLLFVLLPLLELYVLIEVGRGIGGLTTIALCLFTAIIGGLLIRIQGIQTLLKARQSMRQHELAEQGMHGVMLVIAGVMLFIPGFISDTLGFLLLVPAIRRWLIGKTYKPFPHHMDVSGKHHKRYPNVEVIDVEIIKKD
ncbi:FxsA family protein [Ghiorsea bivora]|uniref:FxsA family protein n=1 Tax=Ghiorsea bivora TaxID=1485545 RepID=UPI00057056D2|nr:FxsA family protein [Ghiorsea bivora]